MVKIVVLVLTVWNAANGDKLYESIRVFDDLAVSGNRIEECRSFGVSEAHRLTRAYRTSYPDASTNVDCQWEKRPGVPA